MLAVIEMIREENQRYINIGRKEGQKRRKSTTNSGNSTKNVK